MKVTVSEGMKRVITLSEMPRVKEIQRACREDEASAKDYADIAIHIVCGYGRQVTILSASAEICKNSRVMNRVTADSSDFDIWIEAKAYDSLNDTFLTLSACLSDIWEEDKTHIHITTYMKEE